MRIFLSALGTAVLAVAGVPAVHGSLRAAQAPPPCDNAFRDPPSGAQFRAPSECEVQFDQRIRRAEHQAFAKVLEVFSQGSWTKPEEGSLAPITGVARGLDKDWFRPGLTTGGEYSLKLHLSPASAEFRALDKRQQDIMAKMQADAKVPGKMQASFDAFTAGVREMRAAIEVSVRMSVNLRTGGFSDLKSEHGPLLVPGAASAFAVSHVEGLSGGGPDNTSPDAAFIFLGKWGPARIERRSDGGEHVQLESVASATAPRLSVHTMTMQIECNVALRDQVLKLIDFAALTGLMP